VTRRCAGPATAFSIAAALSTAASLLGVAASAATADSFTPVQLNISVAPMARLHAPLAITVAITADPGVLDGSEGPLRMEVKLAPECGGTFQTTAGTTLVNKALTPQPATGRSYAGAVKGAGRPTAYGTQTVCVFLEDTEIGRVYANDESTQVTVSQPCTTTAATYDRARAALARAQRQLRHSRRAAVRRRLKRTIAARKRAVARDQRRASAACGTGVPL
jgi:hypothetical protein